MFLLADGERPSAMRNAVSICWERRPGCPFDAPGEEAGLLEGETAVQQRQRLRDDGRTRAARAVGGHDRLVEDAQLGELIVAACEEVNAAPGRRRTVAQFARVDFDAAVGVRL